VKKSDVDTEYLEVDAHESTKQISAGEIILGNLEELDDQGRPLVSFSGYTDEPLVAVSTLGITRDMIGRQVALLFANGNLDSPVIMGLIHSPLNALINTYENTEEIVEEEAADTSSENIIDDVLIDGKRVILEGKEEIVLKCGDSSITLTKAGKILIRGKYLLNRSSGVNRIMGGSVQVN